MSTKKTLKDLSWDDLLEATSYEVERNARIKSYAVIGGKKIGNINKESGHMSQLGKKWGKINGSHPNSIKASKIQGKKNVENKFWENLTFEQRSKGGKTSGNKRIQMNDWKDMPSIGGKASGEKRKNIKLQLYKTILDSIPTTEFVTKDSKLACKKHSYGQWKRFLKDNPYIKQIRKGTNQHNPSIYKKIYKD